MASLKSHLLALFSTFRTIQIKKQRTRPNKNRSQTLDYISMDDQHLPTNQCLAENLWILAASSRREIYHDINFCSGKPRLIFMGVLSQPWARLGHRSKYFVSLSKEVVHRREKQVLQLVRDDSPVPP